MKRIAVFVFAVFLLLFSVSSLCEETISFGLISFSVPGGFEMKSFGYMNESNEHIFVFGSENDPSALYQNTGECISILLGPSGDDEHKEIIRVDECAALLTSSETDSGVFRSITIINNQSFVKILIKSPVEFGADSIVQSILSSMSAKEIQN